MQDRTKIVLFIILFLIAIVMFSYPHYAGFGYGGFVPEGSTLHRTEYSCFGYKYITRGDRFNTAECMDCGPTYWCAGIPYGKTCYEWVEGTPKDTEKEVACK